jgi:hypothetical protein
MMRSGATARTRYAPVWAEMASTARMSVGSTMATVRLPVSSAEMGSTACFWASSAGMRIRALGSTVSSTDAPTRGIISLLWRKLTTLSSSTVPSSSSASTKESLRSALRAWTAAS